MAAVCLLLGVLWPNGQPALGQEELPLYQQEAYDLITLTPEHGGQTLKVRPLPFKDRRVPQPLPRSGNLQFRLVDKPDVLYEIPWGAISRIELFHDLVLAKAQELVAAEKFEEAYDYFAYLFENDPKLPGLDEAYNNFLYTEGLWRQSRGEHDRAIAIFTTLAERKRDFPGLEVSLGQSVAVKFKGYLEAENYAAARRLLSNLDGLYRNHPVVQNGREELVRLATERLTEARRQAEAGNFSEAHFLVRRALGIWPQLKEALDFSEELQRKYPRVVVAVTEPVPPGELRPLNDWASRRVMRLVARNLFEFAGPSLEGGRYTCPVGDYEWDRSTLRLTVRLRPGIRCPTSGEEELTAPRLAAQLLELSFAQGPTGSSQARELIRQIACPDLYTLEVQLTSPHLRPEAVLNFPLEASPYVVAVSFPPPVAATTEKDAAGNGQEEGLANDAPPLPPWAQRAWIGPYRLIHVDEKYAIFRPVPGYFAQGDGDIREIVEVFYPSVGAALDALRAGEVDLVDRVPPWMVERWVNTPEVVIEPYALPLVHCLLPNMHKPLLRRSAFRRGLLYGLDREMILARLTGATKSDTARLISGPFLATAGSGMPVDYAYDPGVAPKAYDPRLAIALLQVAFTEWRTELPEAERPTTIPELVLAYTPGPIAQLACEAIRENWRRLGLRVRLKAIEHPPLGKVPADVDFVYVELAVWEPLVDAEQILGTDGLAGFATAHLAQGLFRLKELRDWSEAAAQLRRIHRLVDLQTSILPLWQLGDYFALARTFEGVGSRPISLYQNVENWRPIVRQLKLGP